jgi:hypothetical protein
VTYKHREGCENAGEGAAGSDGAWGAEHTSTLDTVNNLGLLYKNQDRLQEAEEMYMRALRG